MWVTWSSTLAFFFLISFSTNSSEVTHFCLTANEGASRYRFCTGQHLWRDSTLSIYGKSLGAVPINSDDITAECTVTWPSLPQRCKISDGTEFSGKREKNIVIVIFNLWTLHRAKNEKAFLPPTFSLSKSWINWSSRTIHFFTQPCLTEPPLKAEQVENNHLSKL